MKTSAAPIRRRSAEMSSRICASTVTSRAVVGSSAMMTFGSSAIAIAITRALAAGEARRG